MFRFRKTISAILACCIIFTFMHFDALATTSSGWQQNDNNEWYYVGSDGELLTGWQEISGKKYYFNDDGIMLTGWQNIDSKWYYFNSSGTMQTGWQKLSGKWYYFDADGAMLKGWQKISNKWYYFDASGVMKTGWQKISGKYYYFNSSGTMLTGWQQISGKWYFFNSSGAMQTGWLNRSGKWYYLNASGAMQTGSQQISGKWYLFDDNGIMQTSFQEVDGKIYYYEASGAMKTGLVWINGDLYYFNSSMQKGWKSVDGKYYYFTDDGIAVVGDFFEQSGKTYYFNDQGVMQTGLVVIGDDTYYFRDSGAMVVDDIVDGMRFGPDGKMLPEEEVTVVSTNWFYRNTTSGYDSTTRIDLDVQLSTSANVYYTVAKSGRVIFTSETMNTSYLAMVFSQLNGASVNSNGCIVDGFYTLTAYLENGEVLYSDSVVVTNENGGDDPAPVYRGIYFNWYASEDYEDTFYNVESFSGSYSSYLGPLGRTRYELYRDGSLIYSSGLTEADSDNEVYVNFDVASSRVKNYDTGCYYPGYYSIKVFADDNALIGEYTVEICYYAYHIRTNVWFYDYEENAPELTGYYSSYFSYYGYDIDTYYVLLKDNAVIYESDIIDAYDYDSKNIVIDSRFASAYDSAHRCLKAGLYTIEVYSSSGDFLGYDSIRIDGYIEQCIIDNDSSVAWDGYFFDDFAGNKFYSDCYKIPFRCDSSVKGLTAGLYYGTLDLSKSPMMSVNGSIWYTEGSTYSYRFDFVHSSFFALGTYYVVVRSSNNVVMIARCYVTDTEDPYAPEVPDVDESKLVIYGWNEEFPELVSKYSSVDYDVVLTESLSYQTMLDMTFAGDGSSAPDLFVCDADYARKYINSSSSISLSSLGISNSELTDMFQYTIDFGTSDSGVKKALAWMASPSAVFYNRSLSQRFLGVSNPTDVAPFFSDWNSFLSTARRVKAASSGNVKIVSGTDDIWRSFNAQRTNGWVVNGQAYIDPNIEPFFDLAKALHDEELTWNTTQWSDAWTNNSGNASTLAYFGPLWLGNYCLCFGADGYNSDRYGAWGICEAPTGSFWGGTWVMASKFCDKKADAAQVIRDICLNNTNLTDMARNGEFVNSKTVDRNMTYMSSAKLDWLGGQNPYGVLYNIAVSTVYNSSLDNTTAANEFLDVVDAYVNGNYSNLAQAKADFIRRYNALIG